MLTTKYAPDEMRQINRALDQYSAWLKKYPQYVSGQDPKLDAERKTLRDHVAQTCAAFHRGSNAKFNNQNPQASHV